MPVDGDILVAQIAGPQPVTGRTLPQFEGHLPGVGLHQGNRGGLIVNRALTIFKQQNLLIQFIFIRQTIQVL